MKSKLGLQSPLLQMSRDQSLYSDSDKIDVIDKSLISASEYEDIPFGSLRQIKFPKVTPACSLKAQAYTTVTKSGVAVILSTGEYCYFRFHESFTHHYSVTPTLYAEGT
jgi:hypothetical protein